MGRSRRVVPSSNCDGAAACRQADCRIRRPWREQYFSVQLFSASESQTVVEQWDTWED